MFDWKLKELRKVYPNAACVSKADLRAFLREAIPALVLRYIVTSYSLKACSAISPEFAAIASASGIATFVTRIPGHVLNVVCTDSGPVIVDLSAIQFEVCGDAEDEYQELSRLMQRVVANPFAAVSLSSVRWQDVSENSLEVPRTQYRTAQEALDEYKKLTANARRFHGFKNDGAHRDFMDRYNGFMLGADDAVLARVNPTKRLSWWRV